MKRNLWIVVLFCITVEVFGQYRPYRPIVEENKVWYSTYSPCLSSINYTEHTRYVMKGDTAIGNFVYKKVQVQPYCNKYFFMRETDSLYGEHHNVYKPSLYASSRGTFVYLLRSGDSTESLLYQRLRFWSGYINQNIFDNGNNLFSYNFVSPISRPDSINYAYPVTTDVYLYGNKVFDTWVEGIGSRKRLDYNISEFVSFDDFTVKCVTVNDSLIYSNGTPNCPYYIADFTFSGTCLGDTTIIELHACVDLDSVIWELPGQMPKKLDGQVSIQKLFLPNAGNYPIKVTTYLNGVPLEISKTLPIYPSIPAFSLGADTSICGKSAVFTIPVDAQFYEWNTFDTSKSITISTNGKYWATVGHLGCYTRSDTIDIKFYRQPKVSLPAESKLCYGNQLEFDGVNGSSINWTCQFDWSNGEVGKKSSYTDSGWHQLRIYNAACSDTGVFHITYLPAPKKFSSDTLISCNSDLIEIHSPDSIMSIGNHLDTVFRFSPDTLIIAEISNGQCTLTDTLRLINNQINLPFEQLNLDHCLGDSVFIDLDSISNCSFIWNDGFRKSQRYLSKANSPTFQLELQRTQCNKTVTFHLNNYPLIPQLFPDTPYSICFGEPLQLPFPNAYQIHLEQQPIINKLIIDQERLYQITVTDSFNCSSEQTIATKRITRPTLIDTSLCTDDQVIFPSPTNFKYSLPQATMNLNGSLYFNKYGVYELFTDLQHCTSPTIRLEVYPCDPIIPTAFSPNGDGKNETFKPDLYGNYAELKIYDRWGGLVYQYSGISPEWDGKLNGVTCMDGIYIFELILPNYQGKTKKINGTITLLH